MTKRLGLSAVAAGAAAMTTAGALAQGEFFDARPIEPYEARFDFHLLTEDGPAPGGEWTDKVARVEAEGRSLLRREVARFNTEGARDLWRVMVADGATLAPVSTDQRFGPDLQSVLHVDYDGPEARQIYIQAADAPAAIVEARYDAAPYDLSLWATLAMALPFEAGHEIALPTPGPEQNVLAHVTLRVAGEARISAMGQEWDAWKVDAVEPQWSFWVRKEKPYIVRIEHPAPGGGRAVSVPTAFE